ncbi:hypothetical protein [Nevskia ramosa]|uniref:hypothetical protein n=1 Tax=Nevskia ramosa TaxID=64002 RepID=UPI0023570023|nr:hypothetical protein [Nevskia ramosa]
MSEYKHRLSWHSRHVTESSLGAVLFGNPNPFLQCVGFRRRLDIVVRVKEAS